jgi:hypothetical protein
LKGEGVFSDDCSSSNAWPDIAECPELRLCGGNATDDGSGDGVDVGAVDRNERCDDALRRLPRFGWASEPSGPFMETAVVREDKVEDTGALTATGDLRGAVSNSLVVGGSDKGEGPCDGREI